MGSPAGVSSLLTSTDMKSAIFLALFLVAAVYTEAVAEAEASPDAYYGYYGHHGLAHGYLGYGRHGYGHGYYGHGHGHYYGKREADAEAYHGHGYYGHGHGHGYYGHGHHGYFYG